MRFTDRKASGGGHYLDMVKLVTALGTVVLLLAAGWLMIQRHGEVDKCLRSCSVEAQQLHAILLKRLDALATHVADHKANLSQALQNLAEPSDWEPVRTGTDDLRVQMDSSLSKLDKLQAAAEPLADMQQQVKDLVKRVQTATEPIADVQQQVKDLRQELSNALTQLQAMGTLPHTAPDKDENDTQGNNPGTPQGKQAACPRPCVDVVFLYHDDDKTMFVDNGVVEAARKHLQGIRKFIVVSKSNSTFLHLMDDRTEWFDEARAPFSPQDWVGKKSGRPVGWLYQQTLKYWAVQHLPGSCENLMFVDSDTLWLRDFDVVTHDVQEGGGCKTKFKYNLSTQKTGAWDGDIVNPEYHHFVEFITGLPKALKNTHTAINHWQLMQRDVMQAMSRALVARTQFKDITTAMVHYGLNFNGMSEYEAYFSFAWYFYQDRLDQVHLPFVMREPKKCNYNNSKTTKPFQERSIVYYFTCHDTYGGRDWYTNCKGRDSECDPYR